MVINPEYLNKKNRLYLIVPTHSYDIEKRLPSDPKSGLIDFYVLPVEEYEKLAASNVFEEINNLGYNLEEFEEERIFAKDCGECLEILRNNGISNESIFYQAFVSALNYGTFVECDL